MAHCSLDDVKRDSLNEAKRIVKGNAKSITFNNDTAIISYGSQYRIKDRNQAFETAKQKLDAISTWATTKFGEKFKYGWGVIDTTQTNSIQLHVNLPQNLIKTYEIKKDPTRLEFFKGDQALLDQEDKEQYQKTSTETSPIQVLEKQLTNFLTKQGITVQQVDSIKDRKGNDLDVTARSKILEKLIEVVQGKSDVTTLPEETAHFFVELLGDNHPLIKSMMRDITNKQIYLDTFNEYKDLYAGDINKIKKEAIGKLIALNIVSQFQGKTLNKEYTADVNASKFWFRRAYEMVKSYLSKFNLTKLKTLNQAIDNYSQAADMILNNDNLESTLLKDDEFYQVSASNPNPQTNILKGLSEVQDKIIVVNEVDSEGNDKREYIVNGKRGFTSATEVSKNWAERTMGKIKSTSEQRSRWTKYADAGTLNHKINAEVIRAAFPANNTHVEALTPEELTKYSKYLTSSRIALKKLIDEARTNGSVLMAEVKIANNKTLKVGTIDLLRIGKDGTTDIYDYKTRNKYELSANKLKEYTIQLHEYIKMLESGDSELGVVPTKVHQRRIIQIKSLFDKDLNLVNYQYIMDDINKKELSYIPLVSEKTEIDKLDKLIQKLNNQIDIEEGQLSSVSDRIQKGKIKESIKNKRELVKNLQLKKDVKEIVFSAERDLAIIEDSLESGYDPKINWSDYLDVIKLYSTVNDFIPEEVNSKLTSEEKKRFDAIAGKANRLYTGILTISKEEIKLYGKKYGIVGMGDIKTESDLFNASKEISWVERMLYGISSSGNALVALVKKVTDQALNNSRLKSLEVKDKIEVALKNLQSFKGKSDVSIFDDLLQLREDGTRTGNLVNDFKPEYWKARAEALEKEDTKWFQENAIFDEEQYNKSYTHQVEYYKSIFKQIYFQKYQEAKKAYPEKGKKDWDNLANTWANTQLSKELVDWTKKNKSILAFNKPIASKWEDPRFTNIYKSGNEPLKEFYELFRSTIEDTREFLPTEINRNFIPNFTTNFIQLTNRVGFKEALKNSKQEFLDSLDPHVNSENYGKFSTFTGEPLYNIPVYGTQHFKDSDNKIIDAEVKSYDLGQVLFLFTESAYRYKELEAVHHIALEVKEQLKHQQVIITDYKGDPIEKNGVLQTKERPMDDATIGQLTDFIETVFYNKAKKEEKIAGWGDKVLGYVALKNLGLNVFSPSVNALQGQATALITGATGRYYSMKDYNWSSGMVTIGPAGLNEKAKVMSKLINFMDITFHEFTREHSEDLSTQSGSKWMKTDILFKPQEWGDSLVQNSVLGAMLKSGKYKLKFDDYKLNDKDELGYVGKLNPEEYKKELLLFREQVKKVNKKVTGNYDSDDKMAAKRWFLGRAIIQHRTWLPAMFEARFSSKKYDYVLDEWFEGRYRMYLKKTGWQIMKAYASRGFVFTKPGDLIDKGFDRNDVYAVKSNLLELSIIAGMFFLMKALSAGDDKDKKKSVIEKYLIKTGNRTLSELSFFMWPGSAMDILTSPTASVSTLQDLGKLIKATKDYTWGHITDDPKMVEQAPVGKYTKKMFPVVGQIQRVEDFLLKESEK